ncbi:hypothetical protein D3C81_1612430 [compost metagenome]
MGGDQHGLAVLQLRRDGVVPVRQHAVQGGGQRFGTRQRVAVQAGVATVMDRVARIFQVHRRRRDVVRTAPHLDLVFAVLGGSLSLVQALQATVVALVEAPGLAHRQPILIKLGQRTLQGVDGALEHRGVGDVELQAFLAHQAAGGSRFPAPLLGQVDIHPAGEAVVQVPLALAMAQQYEFTGHCRVSNARKGRRPL